MVSVRPHLQRMQGYVPGEQPPPGKYIKLNTNENPYPPSPRVLQAVGEVTADALRRYPDARATAFRRQAADLLGVDAEGILCGNGSDELLTIITRAFVGEGKRVRYPYPSYVLYRTLAEIQNAQVDEVRFEEDWTLPEAFGDSDPNVALAFVPNPNSPSGTRLAPDALAAFAERLDCPLVVDEAYVEFADGDCLELVERCSNVIVTRTLSKSYALAGVRFGYLVARPEIVAQLNKVKDSYNCDAVSLAAAAAAISDTTWLEETRKRIRKTRSRMIAELTALGFDVTPSQANFVWCRHPRAAELYERLKAERILVRYMNYPPVGDGLRISVGTDEQIDALLHLLPPLMAS